MADGSRADADAAVKGEARAAPESSKRARLWVALAALAFYAVFILRTSFTIGGKRYFVLFEDAMISMRYAEHLAHGQGFTWNIGEPPIEGFTNLLWVLWMSVAHTLGMSESKISLFIMMSGVCIMLATGFVVAKIARLVAGPSAPWVPLAVLAATLFDYPLVFWTLRGMEVGALALFVYTLLWLVLESEDRWSLPRTIAMALVTVCALLIRSDSVVAVGLICAYGFFFGKNRWVFAGIVAAFAGAAVGGQTVFRKEYFHEPLPNTYYLKLYHISALARIKRGAFVALEVLSMHLAVPIAVVLATFDRDAVEGDPVRYAKTFWKDQTKRRVALLVAIVCAQMAYATYVGGDAWEWMLYANRYTCVAMPALIVLVGFALSRVVMMDAAARATFAKRLSTTLVCAGFLLIALNVFARKFPEQGIARTIQFSNKAFAIGGALVVLGGLLRMRDLSEGIVLGLAAIRARLGSRRTVVLSALLLTAIVWAPSQLLPFGEWAAKNAAQFKDEANYTRLGLLIRASTPPDTRLAVAAAGATPYFAERPTEDLLGKNDRHIAKLAPKGVFSPGHDKWDYQYSLGERNAQLIVETVDTTPADEAYIASLGFHTLANGMRLRDTSGVERPDVLGRELPDGKTLDASLEEIGATLPPSLGGVDVAVVAFFAALALFTVSRIAKDGEPFDALSPDAPPEDTEPDDGVRAALAGAESRTIPTLDGMRGIAVLLVLMFHFAWTFPGEDPDAAASLLEKITVRVHAFLWSGWIGVDLFFVLSGYLITRGLVAPSTKALGKRMKSFWMRRVLRIFPLYYAVVIVGSIVALTIVPAVWHVKGYVPTLPYWLYMQNYALAFDPKGEELKWVAHFWSLAIEEQFYFVWPIVALTFPRKRLVWLVLGLISFVVLLRAGIVFKGMSIPGLASLFGGDEEYVKRFVYRATFTRADGLLLGAFVAVTQREALHPIARLWRRLRFPLFVASGLILAGLYYKANGLNDYDRRVMSVGYFSLALLFATAISMCADGAIGARTRAFLSSRPLVACGKVSYGMYIFHWALVVVLVPWLIEHQRGMALTTQLALDTGVIVGGTIFIYFAASLSFRFFETPFLKLKGKFHD